MQQCGCGGGGRDDGDDGGKVRGNDDDEDTCTYSIFIPEKPDASAHERVEKSIRSGGGGNAVDGTHDCFSNGITCQVEIQFSSNIIINNSNSNNNNNHTTSDTRIILYCLDSHGRRKKRKRIRNPKQNCSFEDSNDEGLLHGEEFYIRYEEYLEEEEEEQRGMYGDEKCQEAEGMVHKKDDTVQVDLHNQVHQQNRNQTTKHRTLFVQAVANISMIHSLKSTESDGRNDDDDDDGDYDRYEDLCYQLDFVETPMSPRRRIRNMNLGKEDVVNVRSPVHLDKASSIDEINNSRDVHSNKRTISMLTVYLEYSNGIGKIPPPNKADWDDGGYTHTKYTYTFPTDRRVFATGYPHNMDMDDSDRLVPIRPFIPPNIPSTSTSSTTPVNLGRYDRVFLFGDSTFCQFCRQRPNVKGKYYFQKNLRVSEKVRVGLNTTTLSQLLESLNEQFGSLFLEQTTAETALIVGSCLWDILDSQDTIQGRSFEDHAAACRDYISRIRQMYPNITVIWKSPMAVHIHWVDLERVIEHDKATATLFGRDRIRYMSRSRSKYLYDLQKRIMKDMDVPFLDLWKPTYLSADWLYPSDGRHYRPDLNRMMLSWFYHIPDSNSMKVGGQSQTQHHPQQQQQKYYRQVV